MFQISKKYNFVFLEDDAGETSEVTYPGRIVVDIDGPLIKIMSGSTEMIVNTSSPRFVRATLS
jgi:hypothetical protein